MLKFALCAVAATSFLALGACSKGGSAEKTGEKMDSAVETATQGKENKGDGPMEKAGESIDKMTGAKDKDPADALHDATDGDPKTKP
ncbi:MAG: hypothetical protein ABI740_02745 [Alphaproteobacteria bacterium]